MTFEFDDLAVFDTGRNRDTQGLAPHRKGLLMRNRSLTQGQRQLGLNILPPIAGTTPGGRRGSASVFPEKFLEKVGESTATLSESVGEMGAVGRIPIGTPCPGFMVAGLRAIGFLTGLKLIGMFPLFAIGIVFLPLLRVAQHFIGLIQLLELLRGLRVGLVEVRVIFTGQLPVGFLDFLLRCVFIDAQYAIIINIRHIVSIFYFTVPFTFRANRYRLNPCKICAD